MTEALPQEKPTQQKKCETHHQISESLDSFLQEGIFRSAPELGILYANDALVKMFGYTSLEELAAVPGDMLYADEESRSYLIDKIKAEGLIIDYRVLYRRKDGCNFWGLLTSRKVMRDGATVYEGRVHDISDHVQTEERLKESQIKFEKLSMELDHFIYSASHEIRSPISTTMGIVNLMRIDLHDEVSQKYIGMMDASMAKLERYVGELTGFGKNSKEIIEDEFINFDGILKELLEAFQNQHDNFDLVAVSFDAKAAGVFYSDPGRVQLILHNVIKNALDYSDKKKSSRIVSIEVQSDAEKARIEIFDNGIGIGTTYVNNVFDMFFRGTDLSKGPGLGLYTAREAVTKLGGIISLNSEYGVGTSVKIEVPNSRKGKLINKKNTLRSAK